MTPMGRGFLLGDVVVWPAVSNEGDAVFVLRQEDGAPADPVDELRRVPAAAQRLLPPPEPTVALP